MLVTSDGSHLKASPRAVQVKVTVSIGHGLSTLTEYWALQSIQCRHSNDGVVLTSGTGSAKASQ